MDIARRLLATSPGGASEKMEGEICMRIIQRHSQDKLRIARGQRFLPDAVITTTEHR